MKIMEQSQYHHFVPKVLLKNFTDNPNKTHIYKYEKGQWSEHNICNTGGEDCLYGTKDNSLEKFFSVLETKIADMGRPSHQDKKDKKDEAYLKIFITLMANRSPSKNRIISKNYEGFSQDIIKCVGKEYSEEEIISCLKNRIKELGNLLGTTVDLEMKEIIDKLIEQFPDDFADSDNSKYFPIATWELLKILPKIGNRFGVQIFETEHELIIGETPTLSVNVVANEVKTNGEEAGLGNESVMYCLPIAQNKVAFMYTAFSIVTHKDRKLRKEDVDVLNYYQKEKSPFFYSSTKNVKIPDLPKNFNWIQHFNYIFGYKKIIL